ncbi:hypothetical protein ACHAPQ_004280 [Fusarium lateritium]
MSPLSTLAAPAAMVSQDMPPTADHHDDDNNHIKPREADDDDDSDNSHGHDIIQELSLQLTTISQRATRAKRLLHPICHLIQRCLESMTSANQHRQQQQQRLHDRDIGPSSVAQFVMVLQLLTHLINRMDRNLVQVNAADGHGLETSLGGQATPITPSIGYQDIIQSTLIHRRVKDNTTGAAQSHCGLPAIGQVVLGAIPDEHKKLRQFIQELQTRIEHSELQ